MYRSLIYDSPRFGNNGAQEFEIPCVTSALLAKSTNATALLPGTGTLTAVLSICRQFCAKCRHFCAQIWFLSHSDLERMRLFLI